MNDRYLYRAKRIDNGEWVEGNFVWSDDADDDYKAIIIPTTGSNMFTKGGSNGDLGFEKWYRVDPSTICQCTGLKDKNGKLIWENDIVHNGNYFVVKWNLSCARFDFALNNSNNIPVGRWEPMIIDWKNSDFKEYRNNIDFEVIGNIFDNTELLE